MYIQASITNSLSLPLIVLWSSLFLSNTTPSPISLPLFYWAMSLTPPQILLVTLSLLPIFQSPFCISQDACSSPSLYSEVSLTPSCSHSSLSWWDQASSTNQSSYLVVLIDLVWSSLSLTRYPFSVSQHHWSSYRTLCILSYKNQEPLNAQGIRDYSSWVSLSGYVILLLTVIWRVNLWVIAACVWVNH